MKIDSFIDYTLISPLVTKDDIIKACAQAKAYQFSSVCVNPVWVKQVTEELVGSTIVNCALIAYPLGALPLSNKLAEVISAKDSGAKEFEVVLNHAKIKEFDTDYLLNEINSILLITKDSKLRVVVESGLLNEEEKRFICEVINNTSIRYFVINTGYSGINLDLNDIKLYSSILHENKKIKVSGLHNYADSLRVIDYGAYRIGTSNANAIILEEQENGA